MQIAELNAYLELLPRRRPPNGGRSRRPGSATARPIAGSVSGNTHGSQITFGAMPDFVAGLHLATGSGQTLWIERQSKPVLNQDFAARSAPADPRRRHLQRGRGQLRHLRDHRRAGGGDGARSTSSSSRRSRDISHADLKAEARRVRATPDPADLYHYEFIFDPHGRKQMAMEASAPKVPLRARRRRRRKPRWIIRDKNGFAPGINILRVAWLVPRPSCRRGLLTGLEFKQYRKIALLQRRPRHARPDLHLVDLLPRGLHRERIRGLGDGRAGDDRHLLRGGPGAAAALDQPGPALSAARRRRWPSPSTSRSRRSSSSG